MTPAPRPAPEPFVTREYVVLTIANVLFVNNFYALLTVTPTYAMKTLGLDEADAGLATGVFVVGMLVSRFLAGRLVEKIGCRPLLLSSIGSLVVFTLLYFVAYTLPSLCAVRLLSGFAYGMASNTFITRISMIVPKSRSGAGVGYYTMFQMICWATGPYIATTLAKKNMFDALFLFATILPAISFALIVFLRVRVEPEEKKAVANAPPRLADKIVERSTIPVVAASVFALLFVGSIMSFLVVYAETLGLQDAASAFFIFYAGALIASRPLASRIFDRKNANYIFLPGLALFVAAYVALARIDSAVSLFVAAILLGVGFGAVQNSTLALTVVRAPRHRLGMASATYYIMVDICSSISPIIAGLLIPVIGYRYLYLLAAVLAAIAYPVYWRFIGRDLSRSSRRS